LEIFRLIFIIIFYLILVYTMVLMNAGRSARNQASIVNRTNTCGGSKKGGLAPTVGVFMSSNPNLIGATNTQYGLVCRGNFTNSSQSALRAIRRY
jgi:hypothetical protein